MWQLDIASGVIMGTGNPISKRANWGKRDYQLCFARKKCLTRGGWTVTSSFFAYCGPRFRRYYHNWWLVACTAPATQQMCCVIRRKRTLSSIWAWRLWLEQDACVHCAYLPFEAYATIFTLNGIFDTARIKLLLIFREIINNILRGTSKLVQSVLTKICLRCLYNFPWSMSSAKFRGRSVWPEIWVFSRP